MNTHHMFNSLGSALRWLRGQRKLRQFEVAKAAGITRPMLSAYETGKQLPTLITLSRILEALDADLEELAETLGLLQPSSSRPSSRSEPVTSHLTEQDAFEQLEGAILGWLRLLRDDALESTAQSRSPSQEV